MGAFRQRIVGYIGISVVILLVPVLLHFVFDHNDLQSLKDRTVNGILSVAGRQASAGRDAAVKTVERTRSNQAKPVPSHESGQYHHGSEAATPAPSNLAEQTESGTEGRAQAALDATPATPPDPIVFKLDPSSSVTTVSPGETSSAARQATDVAEAVTSRLESSSGQFQPFKLEMAVSHRGGIEIPPGRGFASGGNDAYDFSLNRLESGLNAENRVERLTPLRGGQVVGNSDALSRPADLRSPADQTVLSRVSPAHPATALPRPDAPDSGMRPSISGATPIEKSALVPSRTSSTRQDNTYAQFWPSRFKMAVSDRGRFESPSGRNYVADRGDAYTLNRFRVEATFKLNRHMDLFAMTQDSRVFGYSDPSKRPVGLVDTFDLRQAYLDIHTEGGAGTFAFRVGRQHLNFGMKRLVGVGEWTNSPPVFDAAKFSFARPGMAMDVFATARVSNIYAYTMNETRKGENLYGAYFSLGKILPNAQVEPYFYWRTQPLVVDEFKARGDSDLFTTGIRLAGKLPNRLDYTAEAAFQRGTYATDRVSAWAGSWGIAYTFSRLPRKPRFLFEYNYATGDKAKGDRRRGTFDQLYAVNHSYYGIADQVGWRNTSNYKIGIDVQLTKRLKIQLDVNDFYLATKQDALYTDNGLPVVTNANATSRHIGWEPDLQFAYRLTKNILIGGGYARLMAGPFLRQSTPGHSFSFPFLQWEFRY